MSTRKFYFGNFLGGVIDPQLGHPLRVSRDSVSLSSQPYKLFGRQVGYAHIFQLFLRNSARFALALNRLAREIFEKLVLSR